MKFGQIRTEKTTQNIWLSSTVGSLFYFFNFEVNFWYNYGTHSPVRTVPDNKLPSRGNVSVEFVPAPAGIKGKKVEKRVEAIP